MHISSVWKAAFRRVWESVGKSGVWFGLSGIRRSKEVGRVDCLHRSKGKGREGTREGWLPESKDSLPGEEVKRSNSLERRRIHERPVSAHRVRRARRRPSDDGDAVVTSARAPVSKHQQPTSVRSQPSISSRSSSSSARALATPPLQ